MAILVFSPNGTYVTKPTLEATRTSADCAGKTVVVTSALTAAQSNITAAWPADRALEVKMGGSIGNTVAFTINGSFSAALSKVFSGTGLVTFGAVTIKEVYPQWWGAKGDGVADDTVAIRSLLSSLNGSTSLINLQVHFTSGTYKISSTVDIPFGTKIYGDNATINVAFDGVGFTVANGLTNGIAATVSATLAPGVSSSESSTTKVTVVDASGYAVGDCVSVTGTNGQQFVAYIADITSGVITLSDYLLYTLTSPTLYKLVDANISIIGINAYHGVAVVSSSSYVLVINGRGVTVKDCTFGESVFKSTRAITVSGPFAAMHNNKFNNVSLAIQAYDANRISIKDNTVTNAGTAFRLIYCDNCEVVGNYISNGTSMAYGLGIELAADGTHDKNCRHLIAFNSVVRVNKGVSGSGIGGIHLNFSANHNRIIGNTSKNNSFGIYLENSASFNTIQGNNCSDNDGYYGVGIELDWNCSNNTISGNVCNNNRGSTTAGESSGIQIRTSGTNACLYNTVDNNTCVMNGLEGIVAGGEFTTVTGNTCLNNAVDVVAHNAAYASNIGWGIRVIGVNTVVVGNTVSQSNYDSRATSSFTQVGIGVSGAVNATIENNVISVGYYSLHGILIDTSSSKIKVCSNTVTTTGAQGAAMQILGCTGTYVNSNLVSQNANGFNALEILNTDTFSMWGNRFTGAVATTILTGSTNRYTPIDN